jgi:lipopolysaccharide export system permease protein
VIKRLDKLILKAFIGPFMAVFFLTLFVLVLQFFWLYIDDFVGKGMTFGMLVQLIYFYAATMVPLALPLAILLSSIMTFGNLGESYELVAIKSAGIPLIRFMRPLFIITLLLCGMAFLFANNVIPVVNLKFFRLRNDIIKTQPAFDLKEGVFYDKLPGYAIKVGKKENDGKTISNVIIYEGGGPLRDNFTVAEKGKMQLSADKQFLEFNLENGTRYQERGDRYETNTEFIRIGFKEYKKVFDLSSFKMTETNDSVYKTDVRMLSLRQLNAAMDSVKSQQRYYAERSEREVFSYFAFGKWKDTGWIKSPAVQKPTVKQFTDLLPDSSREIVFNQAASKLSMIKNNIDLSISEVKIKDKELRFYENEWHRKFSLSAACMVLFLIGAPLGSIIRKGGFGMPLLLAIIFFVVFYFINNTGEKAAKEGALSPLIGMWLSFFVLVPIGLFLTYKAMKDSQLFSNEFYYRFTRRFRKIGGEKVFTFFNKIFPQKENNES